METPGPRRYEAAELLMLAGSPLVRKPDGLPAIEEWMGPVTIRPTNPRVRTDDDAGNTEEGSKGPTKRRPSLYETRHLSRSSNTENIILGPPKMSFASARTPAGGKFDNDPLHTTSLTSPVDDDRESPRFDRYRYDRGTRGDKDKEKDRNDRGDERTNRSKRGFRDDGETTNPWANVSRQPRKSFGAEDGDRFRRDTREKKENPWDKDRPLKYENFGRDHNREHRPRGKRDESSWLLEDNRDRDRDRDHYRNERDHHRYGSRNEKDPEWLDSGSPADGKSSEKTAHSMEDFQRWKERMRASNAPQEEKKKPADLIPEKRKDDQTQSQPEDEKSGKEDEGVPLTPPPLAVPPAVEEAPPNEPAVVENGVDRFFQFVSATSVTKSPEQDCMPPSKTVVKSRFTSFFAPQEPISPQASEPVIAQKVPTPSNESSSEDREGFQRILKMLGGVSIAGTEPVSIPAPALSRPPQPSVSPAMSNSFSPHPPPMSAQHNRVNSPPSRDPNSDFFLRLMGQSPNAQPQGPPPPPSLHHNQYSGPSQMPPLPPLSTSPQSYHRAKNTPGSLPFDDPAITTFRQRTTQDTSPILPRGPVLDQHGPPQSWVGHLPPPVSQPPPPQNRGHIAPPPGLPRHQGPPPPPSFLAHPPPPGVSGPPMPFQLGPGHGPGSGPGPMPPNLPPNFPPFFGMNGINGINSINGINGPPHQMGGPPPPGYPLPFHHHNHEPVMGPHGPQFGFPHDNIRNIHQHGGPGL